MVSGEAESDFDKGYRVNLDGTRPCSTPSGRSTDIAPAWCSRPRSRSTARRCPNPIPEDFQEAPLTSYGTQKAIGELLLADYTRRGFVDGIGLRLPTICIRPGRPNKAASGFFSSILREPLVGQEAVLPVPETVRHWHASPRSAVEFLVRAAALDGQDVGPRRTLSMPGLSATVAEQIEALRRVAGDRAVRLIRREPDESVLRIVETWAPALDATRADGWASPRRPRSTRSSAYTSRTSWAGPAERLPGRQSGDGVDGDEQAVREPDVGRRRSRRRRVGHVPGVDLVERAKSSTSP